jgi:hypothetical protein
MTAEPLAARSGCAATASSIRPLSCPDLASAAVSSPPPVEAHSRKGEVDGQEWMSGGWIYREDGGKKGE